MKKRKVLFIINPASASGRTLERWNKVAANLEAANFDYEFKFTKQRGCGISFAYEAALGRSYDVLVSVGGDGTANEIVNGLMKSCLSYEDLPAFTILPSGTGSDSVRTLGIDKDIASFVRLVESKAFKPIDLGIAEFAKIDMTHGMRYFLNACDVGIGATVANAVNSINQKGEKKSGKAKYFRSIMKQAFKFKAFDASYIASGKEYHIKKTVIIAVCNGMFFGGGVKISPVSKMNDGYLELFATNQVSKVRLIELITKVYTGAHIGHPKVKFKQDSRFEIKLKKPQLLETDGEIQGIVTEVNFNILPQALKVLH